MFITVKEKNIAKCVSLWVKHQLHFLCKVFICMQVVLVKMLCSLKRKQGIAEYLKMTIWGKDIIPFSKLLWSGPRPIKVVTRIYNLYTELQQVLRRGMEGPGLYGILLFNMWFWLRWSWTAGSRNSILLLKLHPEQFVWYGLIEVQHVCVHTAVKKVGRVSWGSTHFPAREDD